MRPTVGDPRWREPNCEPSQHSTPRSSVRATACKGRRQRWHLRQPWHRAVCKLQILKTPPGFESHSLRQPQPSINCSAPFGRESIRGPIEAVDTLPARGDGRRQCAVGRSAIPASQVRRMPLSRRHCVNPVVNGGSRTTSSGSIPTCHRSQHHRLRAIAVTPAGSDPARERRRVWSRTRSPLHRRAPRTNQTTRHLRRCMYPNNRG